MGRTADLLGFALAPPSTSLIGSPAQRVSWPLPLTRVFRRCDLLPLLPLLLHSLTAV
jgi:hypothetical protein